MSSTNRGSARKLKDFYATPHWAVHRLLERLPLPGGNWLEPGAGEGNIIRAVNRPDVTWTAVELRKECRPHLEKLTPRPRIFITDKFISNASAGQKPWTGQRYDVAIGNPPFSLALDFIHESLALADTVVMLLRLNFIATEKRFSFMCNRMPDTYILPNRPSFTGRGTDSIEYAWFVWRRGDTRRTAGKNSLLSTTPLSERRAWSAMMRAKTPTLAHSPVRT